MSKEIHNTLAPSQDVLFELVQEAYASYRQNPTDENKKILQESLARWKVVFLAN